jgi:hypothetical protein
MQIGFNGFHESFQQTPTRHVNWVWGFHKSLWQTQMKHFKKMVNIVWLCYKAIC